MIGFNGPDQILDSNTFTTTDPNGSVKFQLDLVENNPFQPISIPSLLKKAVDQAPHVEALAVQRDDVWIKWTYQEYLSEVETVAKAFLFLGLEPRKSVAILGHNSPEWFFADIAAVFCNAISTGIYTTSSPEICKYIGQHANANIFVVEDDEQLQKIKAIKDDLPDLKAIIQYTGDPKDKGVLSWKDLLEIGKKKSMQEVEQRLKQVAINQCCRLVYTSGTTGRPKSVMLSHDNLAFTAYKCKIGYGFRDNGLERVVSFLPLSHVAASMLDIFVMMTCQGTTYFADKKALKGTLTYYLREAMPTIFICVPRVWEKFQEKMMEVGKSNKGLKKSIGDWAKQVGLNRNKNSEWSFFSEIQFFLADKVVFQNVKTTLGLQKCTQFLVAAAPIAVETLEYFMSLNIIIHEIFGMSECSGPHTYNCKEAHKMGYIGKSMPGCLTRIADATDTSCTLGEVLIKGRNVMMGYLKSEEATKEAIVGDGWLRSGDLGLVDDDGFFKITGRAKEILITAGGENVAPIPIEETIKKCLPCISNAMVVGDQKKYLTVLLTFKTEVDPVSMEPLPAFASAALEWCEAIGSKSTVILITFSF